MSPYVARDGIALSPRRGERGTRSGVQRYARRAMWCLRIDRGLHRCA